jgi:hypothetical protein
VTCYLSQTVDGFLGQPDSRQRRVEDSFHFSAGSFSRNHSTIDAFEIIGGDL